VLVVAYVITGNMPVEALKYHGLLLPMVIAGLFLGERLHDIINEHQFKVFLSDSCRSRHIHHSWLMV
jgi:uncharacterized membrane protein YfcA